MKKIALWSGVLASAMSFGCGDEIGDDMMDDDIDDIDDIVDQDDDDGDDTLPANDSGMVFALSNDAEGNAVLAYGRAADGTLTNLGAFPTSGDGRGRGLGSQGSLAISEDHEALFVVNAGSDSVSSFSIDGDNLILRQTIDTGVVPVSLTLQDNRLYVVSAGDSRVRGYVVDYTDRGPWMTEIAGADVPLSRPPEEGPTGPAQISLNPAGDVLVVSEKATATLTTYRVSLDGSLSDPILNDSAAPTPFGMAFTHEGDLIVSEAHGTPDGPVPNGSTASTYEVNADGSLSIISGAVPSFETAACWVLISEDGHHAYTTNTASNTVSSYALNTETSEISLRPEDDGVVAELGDGRRPIDMGITASNLLYVLNAGTDNIVGFRIDDSGALTEVSNTRLMAQPTTVGLLAF